MKKFFLNISVPFLSIFILILSSNVQASIITGADFLTNPNILLPNGNLGTVGNSIQFTGSPTNQVMANVNLRNFGFGLGVGEASSGSVSITNTRITNDSDIWFGLWDGTRFDSITSWDGNRSAGYNGGDSNGNTVNFGSTSGSTPFLTTQNIGESFVGQFGFDLNTLTANLTIGGITNSINFSPDFNVNSSTLSLLIVKGSTGETIQIDQIEIQGIQAVPAPTAVWLFGFGLIGLIGMKNKRSKASALSA